MGKKPHDGVGCFAGVDYRPGDSIPDLFWDGEKRDLLGMVKPC